jgi:acyl-CoA thioester hydrolase
MSNAQSSGEVEIRVRYAECDPMGVAHHSVFPVWFEIGRTELLRQSGMNYRDFEAQGIFLAVIELNVKYKRPARYDDEIEVRTEGQMLSAVRIRFNYTVIRREDGVIAAAGHTVHAAVDPSGRPCRLPARVKQALQ